MKKIAAISLLLSGLAFAGPSAVAQVIPDFDLPSSGQAGDFDLLADSLDLDTIEKPKIIPKTEWVDPQKFFRMVDYRRPAWAKLDNFQYFDELERLPGFSQTLGQTGKPYRRYVHGMPSAFFNESLFTHPILNTEDVYVQNLETQIPHYDTRTPFVNVRYDMGGRNLNIINGEVSANATPFVNVSVGYKHRKVAGAYENNETDHYNLYLSNHIHTFNNRYQLFLSGVYNEQKDGYNGGTFSTEDYLNSFNKAFQPVLLSDNLNRRFHRGGRLLQMFRINRDSSLSPHKFQVLADVLWDKYDMTYEDESFPADRNNLPVPAYMTVPDSSFVSEAIAMTRVMAKGAASYRFEKAGFFLGAQGAIKYENKRFQQDSTPTLDNRVHNILNAEIGFKAKPLEVRGYLDFRSTISTLFAEETKLQVGGNLKLGPRIYDYVQVEEKILEDKSLANERWYRFNSHLPIELSAQYMVNARNPSFFQTFYRPGPGNVFAPDPTLRNQLLNHLEFGASFTGRYRLKGEAEASYPASPMLGVKVFFSNLENAIFYDDSMRVLQAVQGNDLRWAGAEVTFRLRMGKFYLQNEMTIQGSTAPDSSNLDTYYNRYVPNFFGKTAFFFETRESKIAKAMRIGVEMHYRTGYQAMYFDSGTQEFYAQLDELPSYYFGVARIDAFINLKIKRVHLHFRLVNALEGIGVPGYYDTPFHPALERTFLLGLNWNFFD